MSASALQATLVDFALAELVRAHRDSFPPAWSAESWAKLLIWMALNCGCGSDPASLEAFAEALGPALSRRMRQQFFSRELEELGLQVLADPAEPQVLVQPLQADGRDPLETGRVAAALERCGLTARVVEPGRWRTLEALTAIPWQEAP